MLLLKSVFRGFLFLFLITTTLQSQILIKSENLQISLSDDGQISAIVDQRSGVDYLPEDVVSYLFSVKVDDRDIVPQGISLSGGFIELEFEDQIKATIKVTELENYLTLELVEITPANRVDAILWGPIATTISDTVGEFVGVVRNNDTAIGIQSLNPKTTGGKLENDEGAVYARGTTAVTADYGSSMQAFSINRNKERTIRLWNQWEGITIPAIEDETLAGSKIALFLSDPDEALSTIGEIEIGEGLPHPMVNGEWIKQSREPGRPYMISSFSESNADSIMAFAKMAGMAGLYHEDPFETWGHFELRNDYFPNGREGLKAIVEKAASQDLRLGVHTLTTFITQGDPFVSPQANERLQRLGGTELVQDLSETEDEILIADQGPFSLSTNLEAYRIGDELIRCREVTDSEPYRLLGCMRGEFGTAGQSHEKGERVVKLVDHPYNVFFPDWELQKELLQNMTTFFNETGVNQMDFDGHEGTYATGMGEYSMNKFAHDFYRGTDHIVVNGSSRSSHFYWHINHYLNWGEPWYGGFRESQSDYRFNNQALLDRNYMPNMLGWFLFTASTSMEDIDWMMARAAGYDAGFAFVARPDALKNNPFTEELLHQVKIWEEARQRGIFSTEQLMKLKNPEFEFHLEKISEGSWELMGYQKFNFTHTQKTLQPGQPTYSEWPFEVTGSGEVPQIRFLVNGTEEDGTVSDMTLEIDNYFQMDIPVELQSGQSLVMNEKKFAKIYDEKGRFLERLELEKALPELDKGSHTLRLDSGFSSSRVDLDVTLKVEGKTERITK